MPTQIELLKKYGLSVRGRSGQHLLIDPNVQRKIVDLLDPGPADTVLEIGPGLGALTGEILGRGAKVWAVEKDGQFARILEREWSDYVPAKLKIVSGDILEFDIKKMVPKKKGKCLIKVISNLPYYITTPAIFHLIHYRGLIERAVLTMQKDVADRLLASPGTRDYGRLTLGVRYAAEVRHGFDIPPSCFTPQPDVDSSVLHLTFFPEAKLPKGVDEPFLFYLIRVAFGQRRKTLLHILTRDPKINLERGPILKIFEALGFAPRVRGEELLLKDYFALAERFQKGGDKMKKAGRIK